LVEYMPEGNRHKQENPARCEVFQVLDNKVLSGDFIHQLS
jgi:hypothetical protein